ncbi:hypothetical protein [Propionicicella superfundia]|uniref:hypothetical protein n=1 Tax=Propionicicella superfundia TaxID=348582 RepID=UPI0012EBF6A7|nr:hypothetical protein [Propionicicella superfundia]
MLAKLFKHPWPYLLEDAPEPSPHPGDDNRTSANQKAVLSPEMIAELQATDLMLEAAAELFPEPRFVPPTLSITPDTTPAQLGADTRERDCCTDRRHGQRLQPNHVRAEARNRHQS